MFTPKQLMQEGRDVTWLLNQWVQRTPNKCFLIWEPFSGEAKSWTYFEFQQIVKKIANGLSAQDVKAGDKVLIHLDNCPEFLFSWFACAHLGAVSVTTNTRSVARDITYFIEHTKVVGVITSPMFAELISGATDSLGFLILTDNNAGQRVVSMPSFSFIRWQTLLAFDAQCPERQADCMADLCIQFTSGTTSRPKAVLWTHANAVWGAQLNALHMRLQSTDITLAFLPLFHTNAQSYSMLGTLWCGGTMVLQPKFSASRFWTISEKHQCTWCSVIPFVIKALASQAFPESNSYRFWGAGIHLPEIDKLFGLTTIGWWGMTETITQGITGDLSHPGSHGNIGRSSPGYEIKILNSDGSMSQAGERGALFIRGERGVCLFKEYYKDEVATDEAFDKDGWFATGDLIKISENGELFFSDRDKDMLKVGAENVAASEIEHIINASGWVAECAVVGQKHEMLDEVPVVFVVPNSTAPTDLKAAIIEVCKINLADFKVVRDVFIVDALPRATLEKIDKKELRASLPAIAS